LARESLEPESLEFGVDRTRRESVFRVNEDWPLVIECSKEFLRQTDGERFWRRFGRLGFNVANGTATYRRVKRGWRTSVWRLVEGVCS
jgi:hypothetical protein